MSAITEYIDSLPEDRKKDVKALRRALRANLPKGVKESMGKEQIVYTLPIKNHPVIKEKSLLFAGISNRKSYISLNLTCIQNDRKNRDRFFAQQKKAGSKAGTKSGCIKMKKLDEFSVDVMSNWLSKLTTKSFVDTYIKYRIR